MYPIRVRGSALIIENEAVLLVEFHDENGLHYNLPGGGVEHGESLLQTVKREAREEASVDIEVGEVAFLYEYVPHLNHDKYGSVHSLTTIFDCSLREGENPKVPEERDQNQTGVKWVPLDELHTIVLYPNLREEILAYYKKKHSIPLLEEQFLKSY
ncbi:NUDIX domain-containing protein [Priestia endophytica]|uniref:NUDIX domain-containing protein n=1 Tax=Priestia endophytica TaxID=135735 RepID=UPI000DCA637B|nr:NUDIX domain-containing protein [Priestia endophytica]RAS73097.1 NUDIX hydrolase [Priestia endophytica]